MKSSASVKIACEINRYASIGLMFLAILLLINTCGCVCRKSIGKTIHKNTSSTIPHQEFRCIPGRSGYGAISAKEIDAMLEALKQPD